MIDVYYDELADQLFTLEPELNNLFWLSDESRDLLLQLERILEMIDGENPRMHYIGEL